MLRMRWFCLLLTGLLLSLAGCAPRGDRTETPTGGQATETRQSDGLPRTAPRTVESPSAPTPPQTALAPDVGDRGQGTTDPYVSIRVFYGTNRSSTGSPRPAERYGPDQGPLRFGFCDVSIPHTHQPGQLESPRLWRLEVRERPDRHVVLLRVDEVDGPRFLNELQRAVWESIEWGESVDGPTIRGGEAFVFVHGFNNTFEDAARRTAQIAHDLKFRGAPILYSWPSRGAGSLRAYQDDAHAISGSEAQFLQFLAGVVQESGARRIHVIAHSMGNRLVSEGLRQLSNSITAGRLPKLNQVILTAPDIDADYFRSAIAPRLAQTAERITIYSSQEDLALKASSAVNRLSQRRLGEAVDAATTFPEHRNIEVVDASAVETGLFALRHAYHADSPTVLGDIAQVLEGLPPGERGLQSLFDTLAWRILGGRNAVRQAGYSAFQ